MLWCAGAAISCRRRRDPIILCCTTQSDGVYFLRDTAPLGTTYVQVYVKDSSQKAVVAKPQSHLIVRTTVQ